MKIDEINAKKVDMDNLCWIYFLSNNDDVVYVGKTTQGLARPLSHLDKEFDQIYYIETTIENLDELENYYILKYRPKHNKRLNLNVVVSFSSVIKNIKENFVIRTYSQRMLKKDLISWGAGEYIREFKGTNYITKECFVILMEEFHKLKKL